MVEIGVKFTNDDSRVVRCSFMQSNKMQTVQRDHGAVFGSRKCQDLFIRHRRICLARFLYGQYIMTFGAQPFNDRQGKILIGIEASH